MSSSGLLKPWRRDKLSWEQVSALRSGLSGAGSLRLGYSQLRASGADQLQGAEMLWPTPALQEDRAQPASLMAGNIVFQCWFYCRAGRRVGRKPESQAPAGNILALAGIVQWIGLQPEDQTNWVQFQSRARSFVAGSSLAQA